jgi:carbon-monoxide dehydrogenase large subunit
MRSPIAHARIFGVENLEHTRRRLTADDLAGVKPIQAATALRGFKHSGEPVFAGDKGRYVGEIIALCVAPTGAPG